MNARDIRSKSKCGFNCFHKYVIPIGNGKWGNWKKHMKPEYLNWCSYIENNNEIENNNAKKWMITINQLPCSPFKIHAICNALGKIIGFAISFYAYVSLW